MSLLIWCLIVVFLIHSASSWNETICGLFEREYCVSVV